MKTWLNPSLQKDEKIYVFTIIGINTIIAVVATQIFSSNLPFGMDSFSHLPKVLYLAKHGFSLWFFDWYCGCPLFIFYSPLAYLLGFLPTSLGIDAFFSYKFVELVFLLITPLVFYKFCRKINLERKASLYATLIFSLVPSTIHNSIIFGRFANIVSYPFFLLTLIYLVEIIEKASKKSVFLASIFFCLTLLSHHFSAYILCVVVVVYMVVLTFEKPGLKQLLTKLLLFGLMFFLGFMFSSLWWIPLFIYRNYWLTPQTGNLTLLPVSVILLILFTALLCWIVRKFFHPAGFREATILTWMILFLLLGSGLLPLKYLLPFGEEVDFLRFQLYSAIPLAVFMADLKGFSLGKIGKKFQLEQKLNKKRIWLTFFVVLNLVVARVIVQVFPTVLTEEVFVGKVPHPILQYISSCPEYGRILAINTPYWVYISPYYTNKPLVDGWYPQGAVLPIIKQNVKKTINSSTNQTLLLHFINQPETYGIKWVLLGNSSKIFLLQNSTFQPVVQCSRFTLFENKLNITYIETKPQAQVVWNIDKDSIHIVLKTKASKTKVLVKEAYFPGWIAFDGQKEISLFPDKDGFISFIVYGFGEHTIRLTFNPYREILKMMFSN